jgi:HPt (histidine-containing phosphotransfer) domain-containing protein
MENSQKSKRAIDTEFLRSVIDNDIEFERELFKIFVENANRNMSKMEDAIKETDNNSWYMASHAFKGGSASIGAFDLSKVLEHAQKNPEANPQQKTETLKKVREEFLLVLNFINEELLEK